MVYAPFQAALDTCLDSPSFASLSVHGLHFTVYAPSSSDCAVSNLSQFTVVVVARFCKKVATPPLQPPPTCYRSLSGPSGPKCPECVPENGGVRGSVRRGVPGAQRAPGSGVSKKCPESAPGTFTLRRHSRDTFWTLRSPGTPLLTLPRTPPFSGTPSGTPSGHSGSEGPKIHALYDWTTGVPDNGNDWRKFRAVPRSYPLRPLNFSLFNKGGSRRAFRLPGEGGDHFHCTVEPSPGHIRCRQETPVAGRGGCNAKVVISRQLVRNCCSLAVVASAILLPLNDGQVEKSSFQGRCHFGGPVG